MAIHLKSAPVIEQGLEKLRSECQHLISRGVMPRLKVILVGQHPPSLIYTRNKKKFIEKFGASCDIISIPADIQARDFEKHVREIADDPTVHGCFIQLPLPKHLQSLPLHDFIPASKDVDGLCPENIFKVSRGDLGDQDLLPCTPKGIITLMQFYKLPLAGKHALVVGRSMIVGRPMAYLLTAYNATVTLAHSQTQDLAHFTRSADIVVAALGRPKFFKAEHFDPARKTVVIDVGINHDENGKLCGDVDFDEVAPQVAAITPVPGGVGPLTIFSLAQNLLIATRRALT